MIGFQPRERFGLIVLGCVVAACFCVEPIARIAGCSRTSDPSVVADDTPAEFSKPAVTPESDAKGWIKRDERSDARKMSDSIRDFRKSIENNAHFPKSGSRRDKKSSKKSKEKPATSVKRRSLRDETL